MTDTVVIQSFHPPPWPAVIGRCIDSVERWAAARGYRHGVIGDEIADLLPPAYRMNCFDRWPMITDLGRLLLARRYLADGAEFVVWIDADVLIFAPEIFRLKEDDDHAVGREIWVARNAAGRWRARRHVHNAVLSFRRGTPALDFLIHATRRVVERLERPASPQIAGPKLLSSLHNLVGFPVLECAGMISPPVLADLIGGGGPALSRHRAALAEPMAAVNLCHSLLGQSVDGIAVDADFLNRGARALVDRFAETGLSPSVGSTT